MQVAGAEGLRLVPRAGIEPARPFGQRILSPQRLPFRHGSAGRGGGIFGAAGGGGKRAAGPGARPPGGGGGGGRNSGAGGGEKKRGPGRRGRRGRRGPRAL